MISYNFKTISLFRVTVLYFILFCGLSLLGTDYYVDPLGDDKNDGKTSTKAWRTLAQAMSVAKASGDIVHAAPGVYDEGSTYMGGISNRVVISAGVGLVADYGRTVTTIVGAPDPATGACGPYATRGVYLSKNAWIRGFKISNGYTTNTSSDSARNGGGIYAKDTTGVAVECEFTGNCGFFRGYAAYQTSLLRCYVHDNISGDSSASGYIAESALLCDSVITTPSTSAAYATRNVKKIVNCTIDGYIGLGSGTCEVYNSYVRNFYPYYTWIIKNCVTGASETQLTTEKISKSNCTYSVPIDNLFDPSQRPKANNILVNKGDTNLYQNNYPSEWVEKFRSPLDYAGGVRIVDSAIDIGAGEWQPVPEPQPTNLVGTIFSVHGSRHETGVNSFAVAVRGEPAMWSVVIPPNPQSSEVQAAFDLRSDIYKTTHVNLPLECGTNPSRGIFIKIVQDAQLGEDGFRLKMEGRRLRITGGKRGVLYGVYEFLERYADCGWYAAWFSDYPARDSIVIPTDLDEVHIPAFDMRGTSSYYNDAAFSAHQRLNGLNQTFDAAHGGNTPYRFFDPEMGSCHTVLKLVNPADYKDLHPEYFSYRQSSSGYLTSSSTQLCLTNPEVLEIVKEKVVQAAINNPTIKYFGVSQADNQNYCECDRCLASYEQYEHSGTILRFVNTIADEVKKVRPDAWVETLAYQYSRRPPKGGVVPRDNVMICFCSIGSEFGRSFKDSDLATGGFTNNVYFKEDIAVWRKIAKRIYVWDYACNFYHYPFPFLDFGVIQPNLQFFRDEGVNQVFEQGSGGGTANWYGDLRIYLFSKLLWNPDLDLDIYKNRFFTRVYGSAALIIQDDFNAFASIPVGGEENPVKLYVDPDTSILSDSDLDDSIERWLQATKLVQDDRSEVQRAVKIGLFCMDYSSVRRYIFQIKNLFPLVFTTDSDASKYQRLLRMSAAARRAQAALAIDSTLRLSEDADRNKANKEAIDWFANYQVPTVGQDVFIVPADDIENLANASYASKSETPGMTGTFVWELDGSHKKWMFHVESNRFVDKANSAYNIYVRLRVEGLGEENVSHGSNLWNTRENGETGDEHPSVNVTNYKAAEKDENGFAWFLIKSNWQPKEGGYLSMGPGFYLEGANSFTRNPAFQKLQFDAFKVERVSN